MARQTTVVTPENIPLVLELAGIGTRFGALLVDMLIQSIATIIGLIIFGIIAGVAGVSGVGGDALIVAALIIFIFLIWFGYFILFEAIWNGQTPGKRVFGLRVVRDGGYPVNFFAVATRNLIRIADFLPASYAAGAIAVFLNPEYKRLGDLVAGTLVIKEQAINPLAAFQSVAPAGTAAVSSCLPESVVNPYDALTHDELALLRRYALRRWEMTSDDSERLAYRLIVPLVPRLNLTFLPGVPPRYADLASVLVQAADAREGELAAQAR